MLSVCVCALYYDLYSVDAMLDNVQSCDDIQLFKYLAVVTKKGLSATIADNLLRGCKHFGWAALHDSLYTMLQHNVTMKVGDIISFVAMLCQTDKASTVRAATAYLHEACYSGSCCLTCQPCTVFQWFLTSKCFSL